MSRMFARQRAFSARPGARHDASVPGARAPKAFEFYDFFMKLYATNDSRFVFSRKSALINGIDL